jgi:sRNA-binding carbon storage regulator CsrA
LSQIKQDLRVGESISFDEGRIVVTLLEKSGQRARLDIRADDAVKVTVNKSEIAASLAKNGLTRAVGA